MADARTYVEADFAVACKVARRRLSQRRGSKVTQAEMAEILGCERTYLSSLETGRSQPSLAMLASMAEAAGCRLSFLLAEAER